MTKLIVPCKGCTTETGRTPECHKDCEKYQTYRKAKDKLNAELKAKAMHEQEQNDIEKSRKKRIATGRFSKSRRSK